jgi:hypothetical protein
MKLEVDDDALPRAGLWDEVTVQPVFTLRNILLQFSAEPIEWHISDNSSREERTPFVIKPNVCRVVSDEPSRLQQPAGFKLFFILGHIARSSYCV